MVGDVGRLLAFAFTLLLAALAPGWRVVGVLALAALLALILSREAFGLAARDRTWPLLALLVVGLGAFMGDLTLEVGPLALSPEGLALGTQMLLRALAILLAVYTLTSALSLSTVAALFERLGLKGLGFALGVAVNSLPIVQRSFQEVATALRLRGGFRRRRLHALRLLLLTTTVNSVRHAEEIVAAAEARGFRVDRRQPLPFHWRRGDLALLGILLAVAAIVLSNW
ncbi:MAG: CbiQ family ECF transporter T component [Chloroflexota bacterium]